MARSEIGRGRTVLVGPSRYAELCAEGRALLVDHGFELIENAGVKPMEPEEVAVHLPDIDAAVVGLEVWKADVLALAPRLRILARLGVGLDNVDLVEARARGIDVTNVPGGNANAVAELAIGLILAVWRRIPVMDAAVRRGGWDRFTGTELAGKTVGLVGFGAIAQKIATRLRGFDVELIAADPYGDQTIATALGVRLVPLERLRTDSDVVSVNAPHTPQTHHLVDEAFLAGMKTGAILINTSRGGVVDEEALHAALSEGRIAGAGLDVWETEPVPTSNPLLTLDTLVGTPHGAADTHEAYRTVGVTTARAIVDVFSGVRPQNLRN